MWRLIPTSYSPPKHLENKQKEHIKLSIEAILTALYRVGLRSFSFGGNTDSERYFGEICPRIHHRIIWHSPCNWKNLGRANKRNKDSNPRAWMQPLSRSSSHYPLVTPAAYRAYSKQRICDVHCRVRILYHCTGYKPHKLMNGCWQWRCVASNKEYCRPTYHFILITL